jgi:hypothetical protein
LYFIVHLLISVRADLTGTGCACREKAIPRHHGAEFPYRCYIPLSGSRFQESFLSRHFFIGSSKFISKTISDAIDY